MDAIRAARSQRRSHERYHNVARLGAGAARRRAMSRTFKDMSGGVRERRRSTVLGRERARVSACAMRAPLGGGHVRRGRRKETRSRAPEKEEVG
jgi:hypothetical protein